MARYQLTTIGVFDTQTDAWIPADPRNRDWRRYQAWLKDGNTPDPETPQAQATERERVIEGLRNDPVMKALVRRIAKAESKTPGQIESEISQEAPDE